MTLSCVALLAGASVAAAEALPEHWVAPGAIEPPPVNPQIEAEAEAHQRQPPAPAPAPSIPIGRLVAQAQNDLAGFGPVVRGKPSETIDALEWALDIQPGAAAAEREAAVLRERGFEKGAFIDVTGRREGPRLRREAVSAGMVFATSAGASEETADEVTGDRKAFAKRSRDTSLIQRSVRGVPGSVELGERNRLGAVDNVMFSIGRCYFVIGDSLKKRSSARQVELPVRSAAVAVYSRAKDVCASS